MCHPTEENWWKKYAVYQIYPRSFKDSTGNGTGDIKGIIEKLDYFQWLGIKIIWLSPIYQSPMADFGYDISDYRKIDLIFGSLEDFNDLVKEMHKRGMYLLMDFVANHTSDKHEWFRKSMESISPYDNYYVWKDPIIDPETGRKSTPNNWSVFGGSVWEWCEGRKQYYMHNFLPEQPDLNFRNPMVRKEMMDVLEYWMKLGVDGFRADAVSFLVHEENLEEGFDNLVGPLREPHHIKNFLEQPETFGVIKEFAEFTQKWGFENQKHILFMTEAYVTEEHMKNYYKTGIDWPFNFAFIGLTRTLFSHKTTPAQWIRDRIEDSMRVIGKEDWWPNWVIGNHDQKRIATRLGDTVFTDVGNMLLLLLPGTPTCYYGDELGLSDVHIPNEMMKDPVAFRKGASESRDPCRTPMPWTPSDSNAGFTAPDTTPWLPLNPDYKKRNVASQQAASEKISAGLNQSEFPLHLHNFRELLKLKQNDPVFAHNTGKNLMLLESGAEDVFMFMRFPESESIDHAYLIILEFGLRDSSGSITILPKFQLDFGPTFRVDAGTLIFCTNAFIPKTADPPSKLSEKVFGFKRNSTPLSAAVDLHKVISFNKNLSLAKGQGLIFRINLEPKNCSPMFLSSIPVGAEKNQKKKYCSLM